MAIQSALKQLALAEAQRAGLDPRFFADLIKTESNWNPNAVNPSSGAWGLGQAMPATAAQPGYRVKPLAPGAGPEEQLRFAADFASGMYNQVGGRDYVDTAVAYNYGPGNYEKWKAGGSDGRALPTETWEYVYLTTGENLDPSRELTDRMKREGPGSVGRGPAPGAGMSSPSVGSAMLDDRGTVSSMMDDAALPPGGATRGSSMSLMEEEEGDPTLTMDINSGMASFGKALSQMAAGQPVDVSDVGRDYYKRRQERADKEQTDKARGSMAKLASDRLGIPLEEAMNIPMDTLSSWYVQQKGFDQEDKTLDKKLEFEGYQKGLDRSLSEQKLMQDAGFHSDQMELSWNNAKQVAEHNKDRLNLDTNKFIADNMRYKEDRAIETAKYNRASAASKNSGEAARDFLANSYEKVGALDEADRVRNMPADAFSDPSMVNQFNDIMKSMYASSKSEATADMKNIEALIQMRKDDPEGAAIFEKMVMPAGGVTVDLAEKAASRIAVEEYRTGAETLGTIKDGVRAARENINTAKSIRLQMDDPNVRSGAITNLFDTYIGKYLADAGLTTEDYNKALSSAQGMQAMMNQIFPKFRAEGSGTQSDWESKKLMESFATLGNTPEGNKLILDAFISQQERALAYQSGADRWLHENKSMAGYEEQFTKWMKEGDVRAGPSAVWDAGAISPDNLVSNIDEGFIKPGSIIYGEDGKSSVLKTPEAVAAYRAWLLKKDEE